MEFEHSGIWVARFECHPRYQYKRNMHDNV
jgi:hypothetical protein